MSTFRLYKYLSINKPEDWNYRRKLLVDRELYFSDPKTFNDPLDCTLLAEENDNNDILKYFLKPFSAFCLSMEERDDSLMFSHYGDSHKGFRLTFEVNKDNTIDESSPLELGEPVIYLSELPKFEKSNVHRMPYTKSCSWKYEAEYRILKVSGKKYIYSPDSLIEISYGYRMNRDFESVIKYWVESGGHKRAKFLRAVPSRSLICFDYVDA